MSFLLVFLCLFSILSVKTQVCNFTTSNSLVVTSFQANAKPSWWEFCYFPDCGEDCCTSGASFDSIIFRSGTMTCHLDRNSYNGSCSIVDVMYDLSFSQFCNGMIIDLGDTLRPSKYICH